MVFRQISMLAAVAIATPVFAGAYPDVQRRSIYVPVRDGTKIAVNLYTPAQAGAIESKQLPVVFVFTPYRARFRAKD